MIKGRIECTYEGISLRRVIYYDAPDGAASWTLYDMNGESKDSDFATRRAYIKKGNFNVIPHFSGQNVYTHKYRGLSFELDRGFIMVEPIIDVGGGDGFFADKAARVLWLKPDGTETVLYRAADHWKALKPPGLAESVVKGRQAKLIEVGEHVVGMSLNDILGEADSRMGSGMDYRLFYLEDSLAVVSCGYSKQVKNGTTIGSIRIVKPGLTNLTIGEWLGAAKPATTSPHQ
jgi:hypothetical protein